MSSSLDIFLQICDFFYNFFFSLCVINCTNFCMELYEYWHVTWRAGRASPYIRASMYFVISVHSKWYDSYFYCKKSKKQKYLTEKDRNRNYKILFLLFSVFFCPPLDLDKMRRKRVLISNLWRLKKKQKNYQLTPNLSLIHEKLIENGPTDLTTSRQRYFSAHNLKEWSAIENMLSEQEVDPQKSYQQW